MPEGHTIHRLAHDLGRDLRGRPIIASSPQGRFAASAAQLDGATLVRAEAFGKQLFLDWSHGDVLSIHLGLIGKFRRTPVDRAPSPQARLRLVPDGDAVAWDLTGPMVCEIIDPVARARIAGAIGPDPLRRGGSVDEFVRRSQAKRAPIGAVLLDQQVIAGIGNVYRAEVCFLCGIDPRRSAASLREDELRALWHETVTQLRNGVRLNRIVTRAPADLGRSILARVPVGERLYAYKRGGDPCHRCSELIQSVEIGGRSTWFCPSCQS
jgi:endonuclease-8